MNRMIRGLAGLMVALGASACVNDPSVDYANDPSKIVLDPQTMFVTHGTEKQVFARLADERNRATPTEFQISNVSAGLTVRIDSTYRMDYINGDSLSWRPVQHQHRLWVGSTNPQGAMGSFTVSAQGISTTATVRILPANLGAALSKTAPDLGEAVTLTAPANLSFTDATTITFTPGGAAVITDRSAKSISFIPRPGSEGPATVTGISLDYAPTLAARTLVTTNEITVPAVTSIPLVYSSTTPGPAQPITVSANGFKFLPNVSFTYGGSAAFVLSVSADSNQAVILPPPVMAGQTATVSNVVLGFLTNVPLTNLESNSAVTTVEYPVAPVGGTTIGNAPVINAASPGVGVVYGESGTLNFGAEVNYLGGTNQGLPRYYKLVVTQPGSYNIRIGWNGGGDMDLYLRDETGATNIANAPTGNNPEQVTANLEAGTYLIVLHNWRGLGPVPTRVLITVK
jgi:hypothetical protein